MKIFENYLVRRFLRGTVASIIGGLILVIDPSNPTKAYEFFTSPLAFKYLVGCVIVGLVLTADKYLRSKGK